MTVAAYISAAYPPAFIGSIGWKEILLILVVILLLFGGKKLPELARGLGKGMREFRDSLRGVKDDIEGTGDGDDDPRPARADKAKKADKADEADDES